MTHTRYATLITGLIAAWFAVSAAGSAAGWFHFDLNQPPLPLLLAVVVPMALFIGWYALSRGFREFVLSIDVKMLTMMQAWRILGFAFVVLYTYHLLPGDFALPAGLGDMAIGLTAVFVANRWTEPQHRTAFIVWQLLGMLDLVTAIGSGALGRLYAPAQFVGPTAISMTPMQGLPLSLIPTFGVPLFLLIHLASIAQARRWPRRAGATLPVQALRSAL